MATIDSGNPVNEANPKTVRTTSKFDLSYHQFNTHRFGEITPHFAMEVVPRDKDVSLRSAHDLRTYTLGAPLMQSLSMKKDYFQVPMESILPRNWDKIFVNPPIGDDVNAHQVNCVISDKSFSDPDTPFSNPIQKIYLNVIEMMNMATAGSVGQTSDFTPALKRGQIEWFLRCLLYGEMWFSPGSLLSSLGCHLSSCFKYSYTDADGNDVPSDFDGLFDAAIEILKKHISDFTVRLLDGSYHNICVSDKAITRGNPSYNLREGLEFLRDNPGFHYISAFTSTSDYDPVVFAQEFAALFTSVTSAAGTDFVLNMSRPLAYQLICAHFYSNDKVDYVYSAELYRENWFSLFTQYCSNSPIFQASGSFPHESSFVYNGIFTRYDYFSGYNLTPALLLLGVDFTVYYDQVSGLYYGSFDARDSTTALGLGLTSLVLSFRHSLRFLDYFSGTKTRPLAVGDVNVAVNNSQVSVVDVTRNIQMQRFLNAVNQTGRQFSEYVKGIFGQSVSPDYHNPLFLAHTNDTVIAQSIENTGDAQMSKSLSVTSSLHSNAQKYAFSASFDRPSVVLGVTYYDIARSYFTSIERHFFHVDRFDMFNPDLQFIGDQSVFEGEINPDYPLSLNTPFGYTSRHMEYKQRYNQAAGGFVRNLPGYAFLADYDTIRRWSFDRKIGPDFIRSHNYELDRFYLSLSGYSLSSYFHFIVDNFNSCQAVRPMAYHPNILN